MSGLRLYFRYIGIAYRSSLQYKGWPMMVLSTAFTVVTDPLGVIVLFSRFGKIGDWGVERILLVYALAVTAFGLAETFARGFDYFPWRIRSGEFDRVLLRPRTLFLQIVAAYFHMHRLARVGTGIVAIIWCLWAQGVPLTVEGTVMIVCALAGGCVAYTAVFVMTSGIAFYTIQGLDWIYIFTNASYQVTRCPAPYLPDWLRGVFTFFMPLMVISYYPASALCGWGEPWWTGWLALPSGFAFLGFAMVIWRIGVRAYKSTGS